jgi:hypothetical protein
MQIGHGCAKDRAGLARAATLQKHGEAIDIVSA